MRPISSRGRVKERESANSWSSHSSENEEQKIFSRDDEKTVFSKASKIKNFNDRPITQQGLRGMTATSRGMTAKKQDSNKTDFITILRRKCMSIKEETERLQEETVEQKEMKEKISSLTETKNLLNSENSELNAEIRNHKMVEQMLNEGVAINDLKMKLKKKQESMEIAFKTLNKVKVNHQQKQKRLSELKLDSNNNTEKIRRELQNYPLEKQELVDGLFLEKHTLSVYLEETKKQNKSLLQKKVKCLKKISSSNSEKEDDDPQKELVQLMSNKAKLEVELSFHSLHPTEARKKLKEQAAVLKDNLGLMQRRLKLEQSLVLSLSKEKEALIDQNESEKETSKNLRNSNLEKSLEKLKLKEKEMNNFLSHFSTTNNDLQEQVDKSEKFIIALLTCISDETQKPSNFIDIGNEKQNVLTNGRNSSLEELEEVFANLKVRHEHLKKLHPRIQSEMKNSKQKIVHLERDMKIYDDVDGFIKKIEKTFKEMEDITNILKEENKNLSRSVDKSKAEFTDLESELLVNPHNLELKAGEENICNLESMMLQVLESNEKKRERQNYGKQRSECFNLLKSLNSSNPISFV